MGATAIKSKITAKIKLEAALFIWRLADALSDKFVEIWYLTPAAKPLQKLPLPKAHKLAFLV